MAVASGAPVTVGQVLQKIEDEGSRASKAAALVLSAGKIQSGLESVPVTFEVASISAHYTNGLMEQVNFDAVTPGRPVAAEGHVRIIDNPKNLTFVGIKLAVTDSFSGQTLTVTNTIPANQEVVFRTDQTIVFPPGQSGTLTFVLDPDDKFIAIDKSLKTERVSYSA